LFVSVQKFIFNTTAVIPLYLVMLQAVCRRGVP